MKEGKFRTNIEVFNLLNCVKEIIYVQKYKSEQLGIQINTEFLNFDNPFKILPRNRDINKNYNICTDQKRL
jgi:hypothetical protein